MPRSARIVRYRAWTIILLALGTGSVAHAERKAFPQGVYESAGGVRMAGDDVVARTPLIPGQEGVLVRAGWNLCGDDQTCLLDTIAINLESARIRGLKVALAIRDGDHAPPQTKARCTLFPFEFRGEPATMCLPWDNAYLADKTQLIAALGERFDDHPALAHVYFTAACSTNGYEGHCRIDQAQYQAAGYTPEGFDAAYVEILLAYLAAFPDTPITIELHTIFDRSETWSALWEIGQVDQRVGLAAWWCAERLSLRGTDTVPVWPLIQQAAQGSYAICQTVGNFSQQPYRFSDSQLLPPLDYGSEGDWDMSDVIRAFDDTAAWISGSAVHVGQPSTIVPFAAVEVWSEDLRNPPFQPQLERLLDADPLFRSGFEP